MLYPKSNLYKLQNKFSELSRMQEMWNCLGFYGIANDFISCLENKNTTCKQDNGDKHSFIHSFIHSFHWHAQNAMISCRSQELLPFLSVTYIFLPPFSTNYSSILSHLILPLFLGLPLNLVAPRFIYNTALGILFPSILCTCSHHSKFPAQTPLNFRWL